MSASRPGAPSGPGVRGGLAGNDDMLDVFRHTPLGVGALEP